MNTGAAQTHTSVSQQVYAASHQGDPNAFLLWHAMPGIAEDCDSGCVLLLHSIDHYASWMGRTASKWYDRIFTNRGDVSYGTAPLAVWDPTYLHLAPSVYMPIAVAIDTSLAGGPNVTLLGPYGAGDVGGEFIRCCKTVYVPTTYVGSLLSDYLTPVETCNRLCGAISDAASKAACWPIINWLRATIVQSGLNTHSAIVVPD